MLVWWVSIFCQGVPTSWTFLNSSHILAKGSLKIPSHTGHRHLSHSDLKSLKTNFLGIVGRRTTLEERNEPVLSHLWSNSPTGLQILLLIEWGRDAPWIWIICSLYKEYLSAFGKRSNGYLSQPRMLGAGMFLRKYIWCYPEISHIYFAIFLINFFQNISGYLGQKLVKTIIRIKYKN